MFMQLSSNPNQSTGYLTTVAENLTIESYFSSRSLLFIVVLHEHYKLGIRLIVDSSLHLSQIKLLH